MDIKSQDCAEVLDPPPPGEGTDEWWRQRKVLVIMSGTVVVELQPEPCYCINLQIMESRRETVTMYLINIMDIKSQYCVEVLDPPPSW